MEESIGKMVSSVLRICQFGSVYCKYRLAPSSAIISRARLSERRSFGGTGSSHGVDLYSVLGVASDASSGDIKKAYRRLALRYHPDAAGGSESAGEDMFLRASEAYDTLSDPHKRTKYDKSIAASKRPEGRSSSGPLGGGGTIVPKERPAGGYAPPKVDQTFSQRHSPGAAAYRARRRKGRAKAADVQSTQDAAILPMVTMAVVCFGGLTLVFQSA